ncbi:MAG: BrnT family toxin [Vicinamibacteria bacterium]|nr:BrnT family toxin [Vicinamibacteria bacterium]
MATVTFGDFEWDADKAAANARKHGVSFEEAATVFLDLDYLLTRDAIEADRFVAIGMSVSAQTLFVVHCERGERVRIISARRATRAERETYERRRRAD